MTIVLVRHAHRDTSDRMLDNGLSAKGWEQARAVAQEIRRILESEKAGGDLVELISSPKLRCLETLDPISRILGVGVQIDPRLDEQGAAETGRNFSDRVLEYFSFLKLKENKSAILVLCSHGDWIPEFTYRLTQERLELNKAGFVVLKFDSDDSSSAG